MICATDAPGAPGGALPVSAQFRPPASANLTVGERAPRRGAHTFWGADPDLIISSESPGFPATTWTWSTTWASRRSACASCGSSSVPQRSTPASTTRRSYEEETVLQREFTFNGQRYRIGLPVNTEADLTTWRFGYEYDAFYTSRGYVGVVFDVSDTNVDVSLDSPIGREFTEAVAPIPGIGVAGRGYITPNASITGEVMYFRVPESLGGDDFGGRYLEHDFYGTYNFTNNVGAQLGLRSIDVDYFDDLDFGSLTFRGWYFGGVALLNRDCRPRKLEADAKPAPVLDSGVEVYGSGTGRASAASPAPR